MASSTLDRNILPSPIFPVLADFKMVSTTRFTSASGKTISSLIFGNRSTGYRGREYTVDLLPKMKPEMVLPDALVNRVVDTILKCGKTGKIGDGKIVWAREE